MSSATGNHISAATQGSKLCFGWIFTGTDTDYATQVIRDAKHPWYISIRRQGCATFESAMEPFQYVCCFNLHSLMLLFGFQMPGAPTRPPPTIVSRQATDHSPSPTHTYTFWLSHPSGLQQALNPGTVGKMKNHWLGNWQVTGPHCSLTGSRHNFITNQSLWDGKWKYAGREGV